MLSSTPFWHQTRKVTETPTMSVSPYPPSPPLAVSILFHLSHLLLLTTQALRLPSTGRQVPAVFAFGDSIIDPGNNNDLPTITFAKGKYPPYGIDFINHEPTGRFCNGKIATDLWVSKLGIKEVLPPYLSKDLKPEDLLTGVSFASAASGYDPLTSQLVLVYTMEQQLEMFKEYKRKLRAIAGKKRAARIVSDSIYLVCSGSCDVANNYYFFPFRRAQYDVPSYANLLVNLASSFVEELIKLGARTIEIMGIPPVGCVPAQRTLHDGILRDCDHRQNHMASLFNSEFPMELHRLNAKYNGTTLIFLDCYTPLLDIIQNPNKYGFEVSTRSCCGTGYIEASYLCNNVTAKVCPDTSKYVFWDSFHPTQRTYQIMFEMMYDQFMRIIHQN